VACNVGKMGRLKRVRSGSGGEFVKLLGGIDNSFQKGAESGAGALFKIRVYLSKFRGHGGKEGAAFAETNLVHLPLAVRDCFGNLLLHVDHRKKRFRPVCVTNLVRPSKL